MASILAAGCETEDSTLATPPQNGLQVIVAAQSATNCTPSQSETGEFPQEVERFVVTLAGDEVDFQATVASDEVDTHGEVLIQHVPPGEDLTLDLFGCNASDEVAWAGRATNVSIQPHKKTAPALYFTKKGVFNCTGSPLAGQYGWQSTVGDGYAFGAATITGNGSVLLTGGFDQAASATVIFLNGASSKVVLELVAQSSSSLVEYRPSTGLFAPWGEGLISPRGLHHAIPFDNASKLLIIGGVTRAHVHTSTWAPVGPANKTSPNKASPEGYNPDGTEDDPVNILPENRLEVVDVLTRTVSASNTSTIPDGKILPLNDVAVYDSDESFVMSGGMQHDGSPANHIVLVHNIPDVLMAAEPAKIATMTFPRMGHTMTPLSNETQKLAFVLGGNFVKDKTSTADTFAELIVLPSASNENKIDSNVVSLTNPAEEMTYATAFHQTVLLSQDLTVNCTATLLVAGGVDIIKKTSQINSQPKYSYQSPLPERLDRIVLSSICGTADAASMEITSLLNHDTLSPSLPDPKRMVRALHTMTALGDGLVLVAGGYNQASDGSENSYCDDQLETKGCFFADALLLNVEQTNGTTIVNSNPEVTPLTFSHPRFGHSSVLLPDGTLLAVGGLRCSTDDEGCVQGGLNGDAEIFNPLRPGEAVQCQLEGGTGSLPNPGPEPDSEPEPGSEPEPDSEPGPGSDPAPPAFTP